MSRPTRSLTIAALLVLSLAIWLPRFRGPIDLRWDGDSTTSLARRWRKAVATGSLNEPGEIEAVQYPPLLPAIVAVHQWILGSSDPMIVGHWLRLTFFVMFLVSVLATYALLERVLPPAWAFVAVSMCVLHLFSMFLSELLFAELPFLLASLLFVLWSGMGGSRERPFLSGVCATLAYLLRTAGVALLIAWVAGEPPPARVQAGGRARCDRAGADRGLAGVHRRCAGRRVVRHPGLSLSARGVRLLQRHVRQVICPCATRFGQSSARLPFAISRCGWRET